MRHVYLAIALLVTFTAASALSQTATRGEFDEFCQAHLGRWVGEATWNVDWPDLGKKGDKVTLYGEVELSVDGNTLIVRTYRGNETTIGMRYYDAGAGQIKQTGVNSNGTVSQGIFFKENGVFKYSGINSRPDGAQIKVDLRVEISDEGKTHTWKSTTVADGEETTQLTTVFRRVSKD